MGPNYTPPCGICQEVLQHFFLILQKTEKQQKIPFRNGSAVGSLTKGRPQSALSFGTAEQEPSHRTDAAALIISGAAVGTRNHGLTKQCRSLPVISKRGFDRILGVVAEAVIEAQNIFTHLVFSQKLLCFIFKCHFYRQKHGQKPKILISSLSYFTELMEKRKFS